MNKFSSYEMAALKESTDFFSKQAGNKEAKKNKKSSKVNSFINQKLEDSNLYKKLLEGIQYLFNFSSNCGTFIVQEKRVLKKAGTKAMEEIKLFELMQCEEVYQKLQLGQQFQHVTFGAATGACGLPGLVVDVAASPTIKNKSILEMGMAYGFNKFEAQLNGMSALLLDSTDLIKEKVELLALLKKAKQLILKKIEEKSEEDLTELFLKTLFKSETAVKTLVTLFEKLGIKVTEKSIGKFIPILGGFFGGVFSLKEFNYFKTIYQHHFRLIWLKERNKISEEDYENILLGKTRKDAA
ncbi:EcsC family protein [Neobacillus drentensis]|uniref:EcsC family protein n=1 Tax=Neobacillus drentensis TaxID=220684 RepID=UPI0008256CFA|nr:EcsC family protein [Neobacillus drentensis]